jgi:hypothetical protein
MGAPRQPLNPATQSVGITAKLVTVQSVSADGTQAVCVDRQNVQATVSMLVQRSKAPLPRAGETWLLTQDLGMWAFAAIVATSTGQFITQGAEPGAAQAAAGQRVTVSGNPPAAPSRGDIWVSGASGNEVFWWSGTTWVAAQLGTQALADGAVTGPKIAAGTITSAQLSPEAGITAGQVAFRASDIGGAQILTGTSQPPDPVPGDLWINPVQGNQVTEWNGSAWTPVQFGAPAIAAGSITGAQLSDSAGISPGQVDFTASDIGGVTTSVGFQQPSSPAVGDLWFNGNAAFQLQVWNGTSWVPYQFGTLAVAPAAITSELIAAAAVGEANIQAGAVTAAQISAAAGILGTQIAGATITATQIAAGTIVGSLIAANAITTGLIAAGAVTAAKIAANTITAAQIAAGTITATQIAAGTIVAGIVDGTTISGSNFIGTEWEEHPNGAFWYSSTPGANTLGISIVPGSSGTTDRFGNQTPPGNSSYLFTGSIWIAMSIMAGAIQVWTTPGASQTGWVSSSTGISLTSNQISFECDTGGVATFFNDSSAVTWKGVTNLDGFMYDGATNMLRAIIGGSQDTWHPVTLDSGWTTPDSSSSVLSYMRMPDGTVSLRGGASFSSTFTSQNMNSGHPLPAAYRPQNTKRLPGAWPNASINVSASGVLQANAGSATSHAFAEATYSLDI